MRDSQSYKNLSKKEQDALEHGLLEKFEKMVEEDAVFQEKTRKMIELQNDCVFWGQIYVLVGQRFEQLLKSAGGDAA